MSMTRKQKKAERFAKQCDEWFGPNEASRRWRADNRRVEKRKRKQFRRKP